MASALSELLRTQSTLFMQSDTQLANSSYCYSMPLHTKLKLFINCPRRRPASKMEIRASVRLQTADDLFDETHRRFVKLVEATPGLRKVAAKKLQELAEDLVKGNKEPSMRIDSDPFEKIRHGFLTFKQQHFLKKPDHFTKLATVQSPKFLVIACSDSRVCPSNILGFQPGEAFVVRSIANLVPKRKENDLSGTSAALEFAVLSLKVEHILVIGHSRCGGIRALMSMPDEGTISRSYDSGFSYAFLLKNKRSSTRPHMEPMLSTRLHKLDFLKSRRRMSKQCSYTQNSVIQQALKRPIFPYFHCCNKCFKHERM